MKKVSGKIFLFHWNERIASAIFHSVQDRKDIIKHWNQAYGKNRYNYYDIKYIETSNVSRHELELMKRLDEILEFA